MGLYKHLRQVWKKPSEEFSKAQQQRLVQWRKEPVTIRIAKPTRLDRARAVGYRAKKGFILVRQRVNRGGRRRPDIKGGRRSKRATQNKVLSKNYQQVAEERAHARYVNTQVLNSYFVGKDGHHYWYEVILVDTSNATVLKDKRIAWIAKQKGRAERGRTSAGRKSRGLRNKGKGAEKN